MFGITTTTTTTTTTSSCSNNKGKISTWSPPDLNVRYELGLGLGSESELRTGRKEGNVLFNNALNTFYLRLYGIRHMVKDHSDSEKGNPLPPHRLLFPINSKGYFICTIPL